MYVHVHQGIVRALSEYQHKLLENKVRIFVRRGGPNYQEGLRVMREVGQKLGLNMHVFGPETHMTAIVGMALGTRPIPKPKLPETSVTTSSLKAVKTFRLFSVLCILPFLALPLTSFLHFSPSSFSVRPDLSSCFCQAQFHTTRTLSLTIIKFYTWLDCSCNIYCDLVGQSEVSI